MEEEQQSRPQEPQRPAMTCYRHPERETGIACTRCDRPICTDCMTTASVGFHCPDCVRGGPGAGHQGQPAPDNRPRSLAGGLLSSDPRLITKILLGLNLAVFVGVLALGDPFVADLLMFGYGVQDGQWWRLLTSAFLHQQFLHIAMNMLGLWFLGPPLESALGRLRFSLLYVLSALGGSALTYLVASPFQGSLGASGAIFGLFGATAVLMRRLQYDMRPILILLALNLVFTFTWSGIAWEAHIGGLVTGAAIAYGMVHAPRERRSLVQFGTCAVMLLVIVVVCAVRTVQLTG
ncbi:rhomboid family intramembrane serine protease [Streptomyces sp. ODS28]|uniref:rhomboid family intramembrane serine protease n=1 Tax=Streptomyces sp. ODS28 TaxID=3136688 RepID=UPI0031EA5402